MYFLDEQQSNNEFIVYKYPDRNLFLSPTTTPVTTFYDFCDVCGFDPISVLRSFSFNQVHWEQFDYAKPMRWPDHIIQHKVGNCVDFAVFMHYYFQFHNIEHGIGFVSFIDTDRLQLRMGHAFPIYKEKNKYWIWNYFGDERIEYSDINGPFDKVPEIMFDAAPYFSVLYNSSTKSDISQQYSREYDWTYLDEKDLKFLNRFENQVYLSQNDILLESPKIRDLIQRIVNDLEERKTSSLDIIDITPAHMFRKYPTEFGIKTFLSKFLMKTLRGNLNGLAAPLRSLTRRSRTNKKNI